MQTAPDAPLVQSLRPPTLLSRFSALFAQKSAGMTLELPYTLLPTVYRDANTFSLSALTRHGDTHANAPQKAALTLDEQKFILSSLLYPHRGILSLESVSLSPEAQTNVWFFFEQLLTYNPHITGITTPTDWTIPLSIQAGLNKNQQWKAALYYATRPNVEYAELGLSFTLSEVKKYRKQIALLYEKNALPWIQQTLNSLKNTLPSEDTARLKQSIHENYLPIIQKMATYQEIGNNFRNKSYADTFKACKPNENIMLHAQIRTESLGFH